MCLRYDGKKEKCVGCSVILQQPKVQLAGVPVWGWGVVEDEAGGREGQLGRLLTMESGSRERGRLGYTKRAVGLLQWIRNMNPGSVGLKVIKDLGVS